MADSDSSFCVDLDDLEENGVQSAVETTTRLLFKFPGLLYKNQPLKTTATILKGTGLPHTLKTIQGKDLIMVSYNTFTFGGTPIEPVKIVLEPSLDDSQFFTVVGDTLVPVIGSEPAGSGSQPISSIQSILQPGSGVQSGSGGSQPGNSSQPGSSSLSGISNQPGSSSQSKASGSFPAGRMEQKASSSARDPSVQDSSDSDDSVGLKDNSDSDSSGSDSSSRRVGEKSKSRGNTGHKKYSKGSKKSSDENEERFLTNFTFNFKDAVLKHLDKESREAVKTNKQIEESGEYIHVKDQIEKRIIALLIETGIKKAVPGIAFIRRIKGVLEVKYPYMYYQDPVVEVVVDEDAEVEEDVEAATAGTSSATDDSAARAVNASEGAKSGVQIVKLRKFTDKGAGGIHGLESWAHTFMQKFRRVLYKMRCATPSDRSKSTPAVPAVPNLPRKQKNSYGISKEKFYPKGAGKVSEFLQAYDAVNPNSEKEKEEVYEKYRETVQIILSRRKNSPLLSCVPGFFDSPLHCQKHFEELSEDISIQENVDKNIVNAFDCLEKVLKVWCPVDDDLLTRTADYKRKRTECNGSLIPKYVFLLRELTMYWHDSLGGFLRFEDEPASNSPHIVSKKDDPLLFSVHVEQRMVFENLSFTSAISSFFHLSFIGQLEYPPDGESVAVWLQRVVAGVDEKGSKAKKGKSETNVKRFEIRLGKLTGGGV